MASLRDGMLDVVVVRPFRTIVIPSLVRRLMTGYAHTSSYVLNFRGESVHVSRSKPGAVHFDGDPSDGGTEFDLSVVPQALNVLVPSSMIKKI